MNKDNFLIGNLIAHRGYHNIDKNIPENSLKAFIEAIKYNYIIELDIHLTKDNKIVVFHDNNLKRACGINKNIDECSYKELSKLYLFNTTSKIPLLSEVLDLVCDKVPIIIEIKGNNKYGIIENQLIKIIDNYKGRYAIQSFNPLNIYWFKKHRPNVLRGIIKIFYRDNNDKQDLLGKILSLDFILKNDFVTKDISFFRKGKNKKQKNLLIGWTIKTREEYYKYKDYYDNLICENMHLWEDLDEYKRTDI